MNKILNILLVDDSKLNLQSLENMIRKLGLDIKFTVNYAFDGYEAI